MGFLQAAFLAGTLTFTIPVVIHLLFKLRKKRLVFSSLRFIQASVLRETKRMRLRDLLLLLLRCAACILVALAFARPYRLGQLLAGASGEPRQALLLVLDDSPSLNAQDGATTRWQQVVTTAHQLVEERATGDRVGLVYSSDPSRVEIPLSSNFGAAFSALKKKTRPAFVRGDLALALRTALDQFGEASEPVRRVVVFSDFQATQIDRGAWTEVAQRAALGARKVTVELNSSSPDKRQPSRLGNFAVTSVQPRSDVWIEGQPTRWAVRIQNFSDGEASNLAVRLTSEGKELAKRSVGLGPHASAEVDLDALFARPGDIGGLIEIDAHDAFPDDDQTPFAMCLRNSLKVLVVEDHLLGTGLLRDQSYFLRLALDPTPRGTESMPASVAPDTTGGYVRIVALEAARLTPEACEEVDLVFLCGVSELSTPALAALENFVRSGRNLVVFMGRSTGGINEGFYNGPFFKDGLGLLPARPGSRFEGDELAKRFNGVDAFKADHPVFKTFVGNERELRVPRFYRHFKVNSADLTLGAGRAPGTALASFNDGSPFLMERTFGKGKVLLFPFVPRPEPEGDLPKRKAFVPLVHQVVRYLAGVESSTRRNVVVGMPLELAETGVGPDTALSMSIPAPKNETVTKLGAESLATEVTGIYTGVYLKGGLKEKALWAVRLDPLESDLKSEDWTSLQALFAANLAEEHPEHDEGLKIDGQSSAELKAQAPDWRYFIAAAALCLLLEVLVRDFWTSKHS